MTSAAGGGAAWVSSDAIGPRGRWSGVTALTTEEEEGFVTRGVADNGRATVAAQPVNANANLLMLTLTC